MNRILSLALSSLALCAASTCFAAESKPAPTAPAASQAKTGAAADKKAPTVARKPKPTPEQVAPDASKLVNINGASADELKKLPGITDALAAKIIASRPFGSKAQLVSRNILSAAEFDGLRRLVIAKQPFKDGAKNAAQFTKKK
jgi:DNA uptake protein ComE-like DNA-binding protein